MEYRGYSENELVSNRAALFLYGGSESDRRRWALETAGNFAEEGPLVEIGAVSELEKALEQTKGVIFVADGQALGLEGQAQLLRCLKEREERPKLVIALPLSPEAALLQGTLRDDLSYRLQSARVTLDAPGLREAIRTRRERAEEALADAKTLLPTAARAGRGRKPKAKAARTRKKVANRAAPKKKKKSRHATARSSRKKPKSGHKKKKKR